jgi:hypothetical protein
LLGTYDLAPGAASVVIRTTGTNGYVIADAVRFVGVDSSPQLVVSPSSLSVVEGSGSSFSVSLSSQPDNDVVVAIAQTGDGDLTADLTTLTFTTSNWADAQTVTVNAAEDADTTNGSATFSLSAAGLTTQNVTATEVDNDIPVEVIVDNSSASFVGSWSISTFAPGFIGANYVHDQNVGKGSKSATFTPTLPGSGTYEVYLQWPTNPNSNLATNVPVDIVHNGGTDTVIVNQNSNGGQWVLLGTYDLAPGAASVVIRTTGTNGYVIADAVRFVQVDSSPQLAVTIDDPAIIENGGAWANTVVTVTRQNVDTGGQLIVALSNDNPGQLTMPTQVIIQPGDSSVQFVVSAINDADLDFGQTVIIAAMASGLASGQAAIEVYDDDTFEIHVNFTDNSLTASQQAVFELAAARWSEILVGNLPFVVSSGLLIDDVLIDASAPDLGGPGGTLGQAGWTARRSSSNTGLPYRGIMQFDIADIGGLESSGSLEYVILHEMGHVLGIGTLWQTFGLINGSGNFTGSAAVAEYNAIFGATGTSVPVEDDGGAGTAGGHWEESIFNHELMTGFLDSGFNPISRVTVGSLADLGYAVNFGAADSYTPPGGLVAGGDGSGGSSTSIVGAGLAAAIDLQARATSAGGINDATLADNGLMGGLAAALVGHVDSGEVTSGAYDSVFHFRLTASSDRVIPLHATSEESDRRRDDESREKREDAIAMVAEELDLRSAPSEHSENWDSLIRDLRVHWNRA